MSKKSTISTIIITLMLLCACGKKESPEDIYVNSINTFYERVETTSTSMNGIDTTDPECVNQMLGYLDDMNDHFAYLKSIEIPEEYSDTSSNITNAYSYMNQAVNLYHQGLEGDIKDADLINTAKSYYDNAMNCINSLGVTLSQK